MPQAPFEGWNVFAPDVQLELRKRRLSQNLVQTRTPFLRYTTTVQFDGYTVPGVTSPGFRTSLAQVLGDTALEAYNAEYNGCRFFTLGLHGWDNSKYADSDIYNSQTKSGLIVGVTYKDGKQVLVRTLERGQVESPHAFPPPGIESATVERLKNGNVLKFTIEAVCYTQQQLDMLDLLAFVPGMTCVLEWGNILSTPTGTQKLAKTLDFSYPDKIKQVLNDTIAENKNLRTGGVTSGARTQFIDTWCKPNDYNYDFAIARIANVKTELQGNKYKTTVTAYGVADNIMYISAYATSTPSNPTSPDGQNNTDPAYISSIREYFAPNGSFITQLKDIVNQLIPPEKQKDTSGQKSSFVEVVKFDEPDNAQNKNSTSAASSTGPVNDLGQEETFYITFNAFINLFLNNIQNGMLKIVNDASDKKLDYLLYPIDAALGEDEVPVVGYNKYLRSTDPSVMLIYNKDAVDDAKTSQSGLTATVAQTLGTTKTVGTINANTYSGTAIQYIELNPIQRINGDFGDSGLMFLSKGVWLNSKAIQQVFLSARTVMEGIEALLVKINAATEGYWNLKITYDEELKCFRLIDDNAKRLPIGQQRIYTFNKKLPTSPTSPQNVMGPDVLDIKISSDYPKLLFSQLAISGVNNASGVPNRQDLNFQRAGLYGSRLKDFLIEETPQAPPSGSGATKTLLATNVSLNVFINGILKSSADALKTKFDATLLQQQFSATNFPEDVRTALTSIFSNGNKPLSPSDAQLFLSKINNSDLSPAQIDAVATILKQRITAIVFNSKTAESFDMDNFSLDTPSIDRYVVETVKNNIEISKKSLMDAIEQAKPAPTGSTSEPTHYIK